VGCVFFRISPCVNPWEMFIVCSTGVGVVPLPMRLGSVPPLSAPMPAKLGAGASLDVAAGVAAVFLITGGVTAFAAGALVGVTVEAEGLDESDEASVFPDRDPVSSVLGVDAVLGVGEFSALAGCVVAADAGTVESGAGVAGSGTAGFAVKAMLGAGRGTTAGAVTGCGATTLIHGIFPPICVQATYAPATINRTIITARRVFLLSPLATG
jgi:hypothetical protein